MSRPQINKERLKWFYDRIGKRIYRTDVKCKCAECCNAYVNGTKVLNKVNAEWLYSTELGGTNEGESITYFDDYEARNAADGSRLGLNQFEMSRKIQEYQETIDEEEEKKAEAEKFKGTQRNDLCPCGSGEKYKKCCLKVNLN